MEIRRQDGTDYPPNSLTNIISGIQRQLRENGRYVNFFKKEDNEFLRLRHSLDSHMNELTAAGVGVAKNGRIPFQTVMRTPFGILCSAKAIRWV